MVKLSIIQSVYDRNPLILESNRLNLLALNQANVDYEYLIFNDKGDTQIKDDLQEILDNPKVKYIYSDKNFGHGVCAGGWVGGIPYMNGELIHFANQDDVYTPLFYEWSLKEHEDETLMMTHTNAFQVDINLKIKNIMLHLDYTPDYYNHPFENFKAWFGIGPNDQVTRANNNVLAPSVIYKKKLHELIGPPDTDTYFGAADFEYWARILFHGYKCKLINQPLWLYRASEHSTSFKMQNAENRIKEWVATIKTRYTELYEQRKKH